MKKIIKRLLIAIVILLLLFALFLAAWVFIIFPHVYSNEIIDDETQVGQVEIAEESDVIDFDEETGMLYVNNEIVLLMSKAASQEDIDSFISGYSAELDDSMADIGIYRLIFPNAMTYEELSDLVKEFKSSPVVEDAYLNLVSELQEDAYDTEDDFDYKPAAYPVDDWNGAAWNVAVPRGENWGMEAIDAPGAWGYLSEMSKVKVGLIDEMPDLSHEDLKFSNYSCLFVDENTGRTSINTYGIAAEDHGTHVAGTMNAKWNNGVGVAGVMGGKGALYYAAVYYDRNGSISSKFSTAYSYLLALKMLIDQDVQVINISQNTSRLIGFAASHGNQNAINYLTQQANLTQKGLSRIITMREAAGKSDFVICVAAGNSNAIYYYKDDSKPYGYRENMTSWETVKYLFGWRGEIGGSQALYNNFLNLMTDKEVKDRVIVVGAIAIDDSRSTAKQTNYSYASFSNVGSRVDIVAPGYDVYSCDAGGYRLMSGTSMAAPHVSGVAGLVFACNSSLTGPEVKEIVLASAVGRYYYTGGYSGLVNANLAVVNALKTRETTVQRVLKTETSEGLDLCFVVDTTGSMGDDIDNAKENMSDILEHLADKTTDFRVALIDYRDFSSRSGEESDYPYKVQLRFTNSRDLIIDGINSLTLGYGGDEKETVYSALMAATDLDWRENAKKVIIILGDAAPLDPEPNTDYTYDDVLLALFDSDISLDYTDSDDRVVDALDPFLINVFSIGTDASSDAADFFEKISESTGGSYVGVENASEVGDAIIDFIEQIEVIETVTVTADFGDSLANQQISLYSPENDFMFAIETDENGRFTLDSVEADTYKWKCNNVYAGGTIWIESDASDVSARTTQTFAFAPAVVFVQTHKLLMAVALAALAALCVLVPLFIFKMRRYVLRRKIPQKETEKICCPNCGAPMGADARFCGKCGFALTAPAEGTDPSVKICAKCGQVCSISEDYCSECGARLDER